MATIEKSIMKTLQEADEKVEKAIALEQSAIKIQKDATTLRDESDRKLNQVRAERQVFDKLKSSWEFDSARKEDELKNRETTLAAGKADLERKTNEKNEEFRNREAMITARLAEAEKVERQNKEQKEMLDGLQEKYKNIGNLIQQTI